MYRYQTSNILLRRLVRCLFTVSILFGLWLNKGAAQEAMTLEKAISIGLENNYGIKISDAFIQIADNNDNWARAGKGPIVSLNGSFSNTIVNDNNPASFLQGTYYIGSLTGNADVQWTVFNGGRIRILKSQLEQAVEQERLNKSSAIHDLVRTIYQQYHDVLFQKEQLAVLQSNLDLSNDRLEYENAKKEFGASNSYNLIQFENAILIDSSNIKNQSQLIEVAERNLFNTLDIIGFPNYAFTERLSTQVEEIDDERLSEIMSEENYTLKSLEMIASLNRLNTKLEEAARKPTMTVAGTFGYSENAFKFFADNPNTGEPFEFNLAERFNGNVTANLTWNLYDGGVRKTNVQNAVLQEEIDQMSLLEAKAELSNQLDILISNYDNQREILDLAERQINVSQKNLEMTEERFKSGQISSLDFQNVQTQLLNATFNKVGAIYNLIITKSEIDYLVGRFDQTI